MATKGESKTRQEDADEWFFTSFKRYQNLNMFELEAPIDTMQFIDPTSLCITGVQSFSKKCEILQMAVPPKLLPKHIEDGLCKDRDFKILCGGYSYSRILQTAPFGPGSSLIAATQDSQRGVALFKLGDENHGVIQEEKERLKISGEENPKAKKPGKLAIGSKYIILGDEDEGDVVSVWSKDAVERGETSAEISSKIGGNYGGIEKIKFLEDNDNTFAYVTDRGNVCVFDVREKLDKPKILVKLASVDETPFLGNASVGYTFDSLEKWNSICIASTLGALEVHDLRKANVSGMDEKSDACVTRFFLAEVKSLDCGFYSGNQALSGKFNLQFQNTSQIIVENSDCTSKSSGDGSVNDDVVKFLITGFKEEIVPVYKLTREGEISTAFVHDGHVKTVTQAIWHLLSDNLVFSTSTDSVLHAWQFFENNDETIE